MVNQGRFYTIFLHGGLALCPTLQYGKKQSTFLLAVIEVSRTPLSTGTKTKQRFVTDPRFKYQL